MKFHSKSTYNIAVRVKENETSQLSIYNLKGQLVRKENLVAGEHTIVWNGLDNSGRRCSNGIYFVQMKSASYSKTSKVLLMK
jgi:flagellar hook assembly protein FlgD